MAAQPPGHNPVASKAVGGAADLTGYEGYACILSSDTVVLASAATDTPTFVITHGAPVGKMAGFGNGPSKVYLGETVTAIGQRLRPHSDGTWHLADASTDAICAVAQEIGSASTFITADVLVDTGHAIA